jgi:hypothetical protein
LQETTDLLPIEISISVLTHSIGDYSKN